MQINNTSANNASTIRKSIQIGEYIYYHPSIGKGSFSKVYYGYHSPSGEVVAIKKMRKSSLQKLSSERIIKEIELVKKLDHRNIVRYKDMLNDNNNIYIISDYCNGGTLKKFLDDHRGYPESFAEKEVKFFMTQIKDALHYLISRNIYHRDIKPQNIFLHFKQKNKITEYHDIELKLGDFGFAKEIEEDNMLDTLCGTPMYMAPEIIYEKEYYVNSDLWSLGVIFYQFMYGKYPYGKPKNIVELMKNMDCTELSFPPKKCTSFTSSNCSDLLSKLLQKDPNKRITWEDFFKHKWFTTEDKDENEDEIMLSTVNLNEDIDLNEGIEDSSIYGRLKSKIVTKHQEIKNTQQDTVRKVNGNIDIIEDYCDRFSLDRYSSSLPISIPINIQNKKETSYKYGTYNGQPKRSGSFTDSMYKYISGSIENIKKYASGE